MYLFMACIWLVVGFTYLFYWPALTGNPRAAGSVSERLPVAVFALIMFSYNLMRWRMGRLRQREREQEFKHRQPYADSRPIDPTFDFSDPHPHEEKEKKAPPS